MRFGWLTAVVAVMGLTTTACGGDDDATGDSATTESPATETASTEAPAATETEVAAAGDLSAVCPNPLVLQTDWFPSPEHAYAYRLIGGNGTLDVENGRYRGPLGDTGIDLEIRAGGPYLGYQPTSATMYVDDSIHLGYVNTDETVSTYANTPTVAVMAPLEINPQILMWGADAYDFTSFEEIGASDATVLYFAGGTWVDYLVSAGVLQADQVDPSYDGAPARFVAESGKIVQQGFATSEPYLYENELPDWNKPVEYLLVHDSGFQVYSQPLVVRPDALEELAPCLEQVIPIFQQAVVDHWNDPASTDQVILDIVKDLDSSWVLTPGQMEYSSATALELGVVGNGPDATVGNFDDDRMATVFDQLIGVVDAPEDLTVGDTYTNEFIDPAIGF